MPRYLTQHTLACLTRQGAEALAQRMGAGGTAHAERVLVNMLEGKMFVEFRAESREALEGWLKTEGMRLDGALQDARAELLWDRSFSPWWSAQAGARGDFGNGPSRGWLALCVEGLAPYFFEVEATAYVGDAGRTAARFRTEYELLFTQRLILQSELEVNAYGKDDPERQIGAGFSDLQLGFRLRYEIHRELAPYLGVAWLRRLGKTAELVRDSGQDPSVFQVLAGIRFWF